MKSDYLRRIRTSWLLLAASIITAAVITGCGVSSGGGVTAGVGTGGTGSVAKTISGTVADGYLINATVFLDKNSNDQLDMNEPSTQTDGNGAYTLTIDPADVGVYPIVAQAIKGVTIDKDTNQAIAYGFLLFMPKESVSETAGSNFISPMSTWVHRMMAANPDKKLSDAVTQLRENMNLPGGMNPLADYVNLGSASSPDPNRDNYRIMHTTAQNMTPLLAQGQTFSNVSTSIRAIMRTRMMGR